MLTISTKSPHKHHYRQDHEEQGRHLREPPDHRRRDSRIDYIYDIQYQGYHGQGPNKRADPMESIHYGRRDSDELSSQYSRSVGDDFPGEYGRPLSPDARPAKHGTREQQDDDLNSYKREPSAPVDHGNVENWWDAAERLGWRVTLRVLQDVMDGKLDPREMNAYDALRLLAACQGYKVTDKMDFEKLEDMVDQVVERRYKSSPGPGSYSRRCKGHGGHYADFDTRKRLQ